MRPDRPFDPARLPFFYGWALVLFGTLAVVASIPGQTMGVSVFTDSLLAATGLSRLQFSNAYLLGTLSSGLMLPLGGQLLDRLGVRRTALAACLGLALTLMALSTLERFLALLGPLASPAVTFGLMALLFTALRFSGQGMLTLSGRTMIGRWFDRRRGLVAAASGSVTAFGFSLAPAVLLAWIEHAQWQGAWRQMALALVALGVFFLMVFRDRPEDSGLEPDGGPGNRAEKENGGPTTPEPEATRGEALRTLDFWMVTLVLGTLSMVGTGITFHIVDLGREAGLSAERVVEVFVPIAAVSVTVGFVVGYLVDRRPMTLLVRVLAVTLTVLFASAAHLGESWGWWLTVTSWGLAAGFYGPLTVAAMPRLFGRRHLGAIGGVMTMCLVIGSALGPAWLAWFHQALGSYRIGLYCSMALPLLVLAASFVPHPGRKP